MHLHRVPKGKLILSNKKHYVKTSLTHQFTAEILLINF